MEYPQPFTCTRPTLPPRSVCPLHPIRRCVLRSILPVTHLRQTHLKGADTMSTRSIAAPLTRPALFCPTLAQARHVLGFALFGGGVFGGRLRAYDGETLAT